MVNVISDKAPIRDQLYEIDDNEFFCSDELDEETLVNKEYLYRIESLTLEGDIIQALRLCIWSGGLADDEFMKWAHSELNGYYSSDLVLPDYRKIAAPLYYDATSLAGEFKRWELSTLGLPVEARPLVSDELILPVSIIQLRDSITSSESGSHMIQLSHPQSARVVNIMNQSGEYNVRIHRIYWLVHRSAIGAVIERVNTEIIQQVRRLATRTQSVPMRAPNRLHSWVWDAAEKLWASGNYKEAVRAAAAAVERKTQTKLDLRDLSGTKLYKEAFTLDAQPGCRRLRFKDYDEMTKDGNRTQDWISAHQGAMYFGLGCTQGIRNLNAHGTEELPEQEAIEYLAALSVLARWVATCDVVTSPTA